MTSKQDDIAFLPLGANLFKFTVAGVPLVISLPDTEAYLKTTNPAFFGETIGRVANRIGGAKIDLNDKTYTLAQNNGTNTLHGGPSGWGKKTWSGPHAESRNGHEAVRFEYVSEDGDEGFPGTLLAKAWYIASENAQGQTELEVEYEVTFADASGAERGAAHGEDVRETAVNVTNHTAFSIGPDTTDGSSRTIAGTRVALATQWRQEVDDQAIPTGRITKHEGVPAADAEIELGPDTPIFDDCFVLDERVGPVALDTRGSPLRKLVALRNPQTGIRFEAWSTEPAFQFYTGEFIDLDHAGQRYARRAGFCVEASRYVDAAAHDEWRGQVILGRGQVWGSRTVYKAWKGE